MAKRTTIVAGAGALALALASDVTAQRWGAERPPRDGACFYEDRDFRGDDFCARTDEDFDSLPPGMNDRISSVRVFGRTEVTVYSDSRFRGRSARFDYDVRNLRAETWNDRISSLRVRESRGGRGRDRDDSRSSGRYRGDPDRFVRRAYEDILGREPDTDGLRLYRSRIIDEGWSESDVREALRKSPEYREKHTMTREKAEDIARRAYLAVFRREPDAGSRGYVERVLRDKWTQQDVERELRKSDEYRNRSH